MFVSLFKAISIPLNLYSEIEERIKGSEFATVDAYISFILNEIIYDEQGEQFNKEEEEQVKNNLRDLGYID